MSKFEFVVRKVPINDTRAATEYLNQLGAEGWDIVASVQSNQDFVMVLRREILGYDGPREKRQENGKRKPGRPRKDDEVTASVPGVEVGFPGD